MMVLLERDGITVQAESEREVAEYKRLGFKEVKPAPVPAQKKAEQSKTGKPVEPEKSDGE